MYVWIEFELNLMELMCDNWIKKMNKNYFKIFCVMVCDLEVMRWIKVVFGMIPVSLNSLMMRGSISEKVFPWNSNTFMRASERELTSLLGIPPFRAFTNFWLLLVMTFANSLKHSFFDIFLIICVMFFSFLVSLVVFFGCS